MTATPLLAAGSDIRSARFWREPAIFVLLLLFLAGMYGFIPGVQIPSLGIWYGMMGMSKGVAAQPLTHWLKCDDMLIPYGSPILQGFVVQWLIAFLIKMFSFREDIAGNLSGIVFLAIALVSFVRLMMVLNVQRWIGYLCGVLFLMTPFIRRHIEFGSMGFGFMIVPMSILADVSIAKHFFNPDLRQANDHSKVLIGVFFVRLLMAGTDWYSTVLSLVGGGIILAYYSIADLIDQKSFFRVMRADGAWLHTWVLGILPWYLSMPRSNLADPFSLDLFRGQGVDLITLLIPRGRFLWGTLVGLPVEWPSLQFYGDGTNCNYNYLGYSLLIALTFVIVHVIRKRDYKNPLIPLMVGGAVCLLFSLGPSLKINSRAQVSRDDNSQYSFGDYHMPASDAVMDLPTSFLYNIYPISYMRATYRWILFPKIIFIVLLGWAINFLMSIQKRWVGGTLCCLAVLEFFPNYQVMYAGKVEKYAEYQATKAELLDSLRTNVHPDEKVLMLSNPLDGDYLAGWLGPNLGIKSFNGGGDKNNWLATKHMPEVIRQLKRYDVHTHQETKELLLIALRSGVVGKIIVPYFSSRWDSYDWPPQDSDLVSEREKFKFINELRTDSVTIIESKLFSVLSMDPKYTRRQHDALEQIEVISKEMEALPENTMYLVDGAKAPLASLFTGRAESFFDYRQTDTVNIAFRNNMPVVFILTGYQKYFDRMSYDNLQSILAKEQLFSTADYILYKVSPLVYHRLNPDLPLVKDDCLAMQRYFVAEGDAGEISGWNKMIDFSQGDFDDQLCNGWYDMEHVENRAYRWMAASSTLFLPIPSPGPKSLMIVGYPLLDHIPGRTQTLTVYLDGNKLGSILLREQMPFTQRLDLGKMVDVDSRVAAVTLEVDKSIAPTDKDERELGMIISKIGLE